MTTKSKEKVNVKDGVYKATWSSFTITIIRPTVLDNNLSTNFKNGGLALDVEVDKGIKGIGIRKKVEVIDGWVYVDLSVEDRRELKLKTILE